MRTVLYGVAVLALTILFAPDAIRSALAASASALFEATPFLFASLVIAGVLPRRLYALEYLGCGCARGPSARSLPAAAATWLIFGPAVAVARYVAALSVAHLLDRRARSGESTAHEHPALLDELGTLILPALLAGAAMQLCSGVDAHRLSPAGSAFFGAMLGFVAAPCGLGAVALAGALRGPAPVAAAALLCVAGIVDLRALRPIPHRRSSHDAFGYALLALALGLVAWRRGGDLVHPAMSLPIGCCASGALIYAFKHRRERAAAGRTAPALMLAGALIGAPPPQYHVTETTLTDLFAGERLTFTGTLLHQDGAGALVRYAITCCRADASPIVLRLDHPPHYPAGTWLRVDGRIENTGGEFRLAPDAIERIAPPSDPFVYR
jgi:hypothetical protein